MLSKLLSSIFRFRKTTVSLLCVFTYFAIGVLYVYDQVRYKYTTPSTNDFNRAPLLLENAWLDLQNITETFHPYCSRANADVHNYLLDRILEVVNKVPFASVSDDVENKRRVVVKRLKQFNSSSASGQVSYFESANILVKLEGKISDLPGLLLSAHYDSVPTGFGATDDGKGIVSLLGILDYYSREQPDRTLIFNFNNNEEFGLLGAEAFFSHPWSKRVAYVINLEGTGTGGKSVLFRTSDISTAKIYQKAVLKAPFGNSIYQQGFYDGMVNSETDFYVYTKNNLRGFDIAFYKPRDLYHTFEDSVKHTSREALWHMFHTAWQITSYMAQNSEIDGGDFTPAVYFDIIGLRFIAMSAKTLFTWGCILLILLPMVTIALDFLGRKKNQETKKFWNLWLRLPLSFALSASIVRATQYFIQSTNPFVISRDYLSPLFALSSEFILINYLVLSFFEYLSQSQDFKTIAFRELTILLWVNLLIQTVVLYRSHYKETGAYQFTIIYMTMSLGCIVGYLCRVFKTSPIVRAPQERTKQTSVYGPRILDEEQSSQTDQTSNGDLAEAVPTNEIQGDNSEGPQLDERAPLLQADTANNGAKDTQKGSVKNFLLRTFNYDWSLQFLIAVPIASFFAFNSIVLILDALNQTVQEGKIATMSTWNIAFIGSVLMALPLLPFTYKLNNVVGTLFSIVFAVSLLLSLLEAPFTEKSPLKVRFSQMIDLGNSSDAIVSVYGREGGFISSMLQDLPSIKRDKRQIWCESFGNGNEQCSYVGFPPNLIDSDTPLTPEDIFSVEILKDDRNSSDRSSYAPINAELKIKAMENRVCDVHFNSPSQAYSPVRQVTVFHDQEGKSNESEIIKMSSGINEFQLHKLNFDEQYYHIGIQWLPKILTTGTEVEGMQEVDVDALSVTVTCFWGEFDSESLIGNVHRRKIPAFDELVEYSPLNVIFSNREKGLVKTSLEIKL